MEGEPRHNALYPLPGKVFLWCFPAQRWRGARTVTFLLYVSDLNPEPISYAWFKYFTISSFTPSSLHFIWWWIWVQTHLDSLPGIEEKIFNPVRIINFCRYYGGSFHVAFRRKAAIIASELSQPFSWILKHEYLKRCSILHTYSYRPPGDVCHLVLQCRIPSLHRCQYTDNFLNKT